MKHYQAFSIFLLFIVSQTQANTNDLCNACIDVIDEIKNLLEAPVTREQIKDGLETICEVLPYPLNIGCDDLIELYFDQYADVIINTPSKEICHDFQLCNPRNCNTGCVR